MDAAGTLYIADNYHYRIAILAGLSAASPGSQLFAVFTPSLELQTPAGLAVDSSNRLYVADLNSLRVLVMGGLNSSSPGASLFSFQNGTGQFHPYGLALDSAGRMYVSDEEGGRVAVLAAVNSSSPGLVLADLHPVTVDAYSAAYGLALDTAGNIYVADQYNSRIQVSSGLQSARPQTLLASFDLSASGFSLFYPNGVAVDTNGSIYVSDQENDRIAVIAGIHSSAPGTGPAAVHRQQLQPPSLPPASPST